MELSGKQILVVGLGRSGVGAARLCAAHGAHVTVTDSRPEADLAGAVEGLAGLSTLELGGHRRASFVEADLIVVSPGVPDQLVELVEARTQGVQVLGELELSARFVQAPILAITGTNGKSTTTSLLGAMVAATGRPTFVGGNLGTPLVEAVGTEAAGPSGALVLELSSFQLETVEHFRAHIAMLLNLSEDHLDRYPDFAAYKAAKARIFERQSSRDFAVVNGEPGQEACHAMARGGQAQVVTFSLDKGGAGTGAWVEGNQLCCRIPGGQVEQIPVSALRLPGRHNLQNALAALLGARLSGVGLAACQSALEAFTGLPHRMELVADLDGVRYYNDSKATNVGSVVGSLTGFDRKVVLIAGGKDKGGDYSPLWPVLHQVARHVVLIGAAADRMEQALAGDLPLHRASALPEAVRKAAALANPGDAVVLSPACSSFDMFNSFEHRGEVFSKAVRDLRERA